MFTRKEPRYLIIDLRDVLSDYVKNRKWYQLYKIFPLQDIVQVILSVNCYEDVSEYFWVELDRRFDSIENIPEFDLNNIDFFRELLTDYVDGFIRQKVPSDIDTASYVFDRWVDQTTVVMQLDENARSAHCPM